MSDTIVQVVVGQVLAGAGGITDLTGDVTASGSGSVAATIAADAVTNAKLANVATATIKGRTTSGSGDPEDLTAAQARAILNVADGATANASDSALRDRATHTGEQAIGTVTGLQPALDGKVASDPTGITGADAITNMVSLTQAEFDAIGAPSATTLYVITDA
jgi:hypothetical protein